MSSSWGPSSTTFPPCTTQILWLFLTVLRRCAIRITVTWPSEIIVSIADCTCLSDSASRALVASSSSRMGGFARIALAMHRRCFSPPATFCATVICVSRPFGNFWGSVSESQMFAARHACSISSKVGSWSQPNTRLSRMVRGSSFGSCDTATICERSQRGWYSRMSRPSSRIRPFVTSKKRSTKLRQVLLPQPVVPVMPTTCPGLTSKEVPLRILLLRPG
mmetsp:Transcript_103592/g.270524  ORF Transcript_103592/g.270524 Transcript_103592/m.270524 type:complete len:220 (-) Transcript_103592:31-690(-)